MMLMCVSFESVLAADSSRLSVSFSPKETFKSFYSEAIFGCQLNRSMVGLHIKSVCKLSCLTALIAV